MIDKNAFYGKLQVHYGQQMKPGIFNGSKLGVWAILNPIGTTHNGFRLGVLHTSIREKIAYK